MSAPWFATDAADLVPAGDVHLWLCWLDEVDDPALLREYDALLTPGERAAGARFHFERDRHRHLVTRALLRTVLSAYLPRPAADWRFGVNEFGKPHIDPDIARRGDADIAGLDDGQDGARDPGHDDGVDGRRSAEAAQVLSFNLSHAGRAVVLALADGRALGVDVESKFPSDAMGIARNFFAPAEADELEALPEARRAVRFLQLWTLKESYLKALGTGLSTPLDSVRFRFCANGDLDLHRPNAARDAGRTWRFASFERREHRFAVCVERRDDADSGSTNGPPDDKSTPRLVCRQCVPLRYAMSLPGPTPLFSQL